MCRGLPCPLPLQGCLGSAPHPILQPPAPLVLGGLGDPSGLGVMLAPGSWRWGGLRQSPHPVGIGSGSCKSHQGRREVPRVPIVSPAARAQGEVQLEGSCRALPLRKVFG